MSAFQFFCLIFVIIDTVDLAQRIRCDTADALHYLTFIIILITAAVAVIS